MVHFLVSFSLPEWPLVFFFFVFLVVMKMNLPTIAHPYTLFIWWCDIVLHYKSTMPETNATALQCKFLGSFYGILKCFVFSKRQIMCVALLYYGLIHRVPMVNNYYEFLCVFRQFHTLSFHFLMLMCLHVFHRQKRKTHFSYLISVR